MKPRVLLLYYTFTQQTRLVADAMSAGFREAGCDTQSCQIELVDQDYQIQFPFQPFWPKLLRWLLPQALGRTCQIRLPADILEQQYDLICIGSPTWWVHPAMPIVSFLKSENARRLLNGRQFAVFAVCRKLWGNNVRNVRKLGLKQGGIFVRGAGFCFSGGQLQSALSFINYMQTKTNRQRYWGIKIYEFGIPAEGLEQARLFAGELAAELLRAKPAPT